MISFQWFLIISGPVKAEVELCIMGSFSFKKYCLSFKDFDQMQNIPKMGKVKFAYTQLVSDAWEYGALWHQGK